MNVDDLLPPQPRPDPLRAAGLISILAGLGCLAADIATAGRVPWELLAGIAFLAGTAFLCTLRVDRHRSALDEAYRFGYDLGYERGIREGEALGNGSRALPGETPLPGD